MIHRSTESRTRILRITITAACLGLCLLVGACTEEPPPAREVFICSPETPLLLTPHSGFTPIRRIPNGERVAVLVDDKEWLKVRTKNTEEGWILRADTAELDVLERARTLADQSKAQPAQFKGRLGSDANLRLAPEKDAPFPGRVKKNAVVDVLEKSAHGRRGISGLYYKVRDSDGSCGWVAGWLLEPVMPQVLEPYREERKLGACIEIDRVMTRTGEVPQYVLADLSPEAGPDADFDRIRVFTWNRAREGYGTAFVERGLNGILPIIREEASDGTVLIRISQLTAAGETKVSTYAFKAPYFRPVPDRSR